MRKKWKELAMRLQLQQTIDKNMQKHIDEEQKKVKSYFRKRCWCHIISK